MAIAFLPAYAWPIAQLLRQHQLSVYGAVTVAKAGVSQDKPY
ncbi:MAG: hypothetical protein AAGD25_05145 [Cyanobacteria bacterium P01_F01_bin.150]